jgi:predicted ATPase/class 3 adenylate cyclase
MTHGTPPAFGDLLKEYRLAAGLTQEALAERAGVSARNIQALERGENRPLRDTARRLAEGLALGERERALLLAVVMPVPRRRAANPALPAGDQPTPQPQRELEASLPAGMLAILVADVRGYTAFTHQHGDEAGARLAAAFAAQAGEAVQAEGGRVVEVRGDEVLAVFSSARAALRASTGLLARCAEAATDALPLRAGVGLDVGEPVAVGDGYRGEAINTAARLCAQAGPGEALASGALVSLARRTEGLAFDERGELTLKGLPYPVRAWLVRRGTETEWGAEAAAIASSGVRHHNLPAALTSFVGREREQKRVLDLLADSRLVTLTGPGGVGKTRLALQVGSRLPAGGADDVVFVPLDATSDPALVASAIAAALGVAQDGTDLTRALITFLQPRRMLLVLDNFEQVMAAAPLVADLLAACPSLRVLATSRIALHLSGEQEFAVPPLALPGTDGSSIGDVEQVAQSPAVALFVQRAQLVNPEFHLTEECAAEVAAICRRLDGLPLAIELAAARTRLFSPRALLGRLSNRLGVLTGGPRDLPTRQQTLRSTIAWSHDLLDAGEQRLFRRLAVFTGGWTIEAAEAVCGDDADHWDVLDLMSALLDKNLLLVDRQGSGDDRYGMLETIREYALERLEASGEADALRRRHAAHYLAVAERTPPGKAAASLEREHPNLRAALRWAKASRQIDLSLGLSAALWQFWHARGYPWEDDG